MVVGFPSCSNSGSSSSIRSSDVVFTRMFPSLRPPPPAWVTYEDKLERQRPQSLSREIRRARSDACWREAPRIHYVPGVLAATAEQSLRKS